MSGFVYLLHFDRPISEKHTAQHYIGWAYRLDSRMRQHIKGRGARFTQVANERGIGYVIAASFPGDRHYERRLKNRHNASRMCPICREAYALKRRTIDAQEDLL
jgi:predicted GIY-YIG superfamily endonuclease